MHPDTTDTELTGKRATDLVAILMMLSSMLDSRLLVRQVQLFDRLGARIWSMRRWSGLSWNMLHNRSVIMRIILFFFNIFSRQDSQPELLPLLLDSLLVVIWNLHHSVVSDCLTWIFVFLCIVWLWSVNELLKEFMLSEIKLPYPQGVYVNNAMVLNWI